MLACSPFTIVGLALTAFSFQFSAAAPATKQPIQCQYVKDQNLPPKLAGMDMVFQNRNGGKNEVDTYWELSSKMNQMVSPKVTPFPYGDMVFLAERKLNPINQDATYTLSINKDNNGRPLAVDGYYTITYYDVFKNVIRSYYISHKDQCQFNLAFKDDSAFPTYVKVDRYK